MKIRNFRSLILQRREFLKFIAQKKRGFFGEKELTFIQKWLITDYIFNRTQK